MQVRRHVRRGTAATAAVASLAVLSGITPANAADFAPGNVVVHRVGTGSAALSNAAQPVFLDEFTSSGSLAQSVALPTTSAPGLNRLTESGTATSSGLITRSVDGCYVMVSGYDAALGTASLTGSTVPRVVARVDSSAAVESYAFTDSSYSGDNFRSVASTDGTALWMGGTASAAANAGVRYGVFGSTLTGTQVSATITNIRQTHVFDGQVYYSNASGSNARIGVLSPGLPTGSGATMTGLPGIPTSTVSPYGFALLDLSAAVAGVDTLYLADDAGGAGIRKYSLVAGTWTANGLITAAGARGLAARSVPGVGVEIYSTTGGSGATGGGTLWRVVDTAGYNATPSDTSAADNVIATAATNTAFRGVSFAPEDCSPAPVIPEARFAIMLSASMAAAAGAYVVLRPKRRDAVAV
jgi:hypothetical protein